MTLVVLLRGINVGGHRTFRPTTLARQLSHLDAVNIGATGTFVMRRPVTRARLRAELARRLPFDAEIVICEGRELVGLFSRRPFARQPERPDVVRFVSVLSRRPRSTPPLPMSLPASGKWLLKILAREGRYVFGVYRRDMKVIGYLGQLDRLFGVPVTTRNWNTIAAIAKAVEGGAADRGGERRREPLQRRPVAADSPLRDPPLDRSVDRSRKGVPMVKKGKARKRAATRASPEAPARLIDARIWELDDWRGRALARVRALIKRVDPDVLEEVKWRKPSNPSGVPVWSHDGIICTGETYKDKVKLTFARGTELADPSRLFNSGLEGNTRRAIEIREGDQIDEQAFQALVLDAVGLNTSLAGR